ncbi:hypothetical protein SNEBB_009524 [Seison nebaliae]|nr:hypothetical protein SNEBB_009524 [Seison nebaliae]
MNRLKLSEKRNGKDESSVDRRHRSSSSQRNRPHNYIKLSEKKKTKSVSNTVLVKTSENVGKKVFSKNLRLHEKSYWRSSKSNSEVKYSNNNIIDERNVNFSLTKLPRKEFLAVDQNNKPLHQRSDTSRYKIASHSTQTSGYPFKDCQTSTDNVRSIGVNAVEVFDRKEFVRSVNKKSLLEFLKRMEEMLEVSLKTNEMNKINFDVDWSDDSIENTRVIRTFKLFDPYHNVKKNDMFIVTGICWNRIGTKFAVAFGQIDHESWCSHKSWMMVYSIYTSQTKTFFQTDLSACCSSISFHPLNDSIIALGQFNGEVFIHDIHRHLSDSILCRIVEKNNIHHDSVSHIDWIYDTLFKKKRYLLLSISNDGAVRIWQPYPKRHDFILLYNSKLNLMSVMKKKLPLPLTMSISSSSNVFDKVPIMIVGSNVGQLVRCFLKEIDNDEQMKTLYNYEPELAFITNISVSYLVPKYFLVTTSDGNVSIRQLNEFEPVIRLSVNGRNITSSAWSPFRASVFLLATDDNQVHIFDLYEVNNYSVERLKFPSNVTRISFNNKQPGLILLGHQDGDVTILELASKLNKMNPKIMKFMNSL